MFRFFPDSPGLFPDHLPENADRVIDHILEIRGMPLGENPLIFEVAGAADRKKQTAAYTDCLREHAVKVIQTIAIRLEIGDKTGYEQYKTVDTLTLRLGKQFSQNLLFVRGMEGKTMGQQLLLKVLRERTAIPIR